MFFALRKRTRTSRPANAPLRRVGNPAERPSWTALASPPIAFQQPQRRRLGDLQRGDHNFGQPFALERLRIGGKQGAHTAKLGDQGLRLRLRIATRNGQREEIFDQLMIEQSLRPSLEQALAKAGAVA
jgi:hypothetical protein